MYSTRRPVDGYPGHMASRAALPSGREFQSRPGRRAVVVADLSDLVGPVEQIVELPHRLYWQSDRRFDLADQWQVREAYEAVLTEAVNVQELCAWLDRATLVRLWPVLNVPRGVRTAWQAQHPQLRPVRAAA